mmetsp:Transcript_15624/g.32976  ORF Transcript_15624/g.32976 Transcript_15624/m.32976 type:complete len:399 (-) Transcript_15624:52-1248(-)
MLWMRLFKYFTILVGHVCVASVVDANDYYLSTAEKVRLAFEEDATTTTMHAVAAAEEKPAFEKKEEAITEQTIGMETNGTEEAKESHAARFAKGYGSSSSSVGRLEDSASTNEEWDLDDATTMEKKSLSWQTNERELGKRAEKRAERNSGDDTNDGDDEPSSQRRNGDNERREITDEASEIVLTTAESKREKRKDGYYDDNRSDSNMGLKSDKDSNGPKLTGQIYRETIAESLARTQLHLRPEEETTSIMKTNTQTLSNNQQSGNSPFPHPYPTIRYVPWENLSHDTKQMVVKDFGYTKGSWNYMANVVEGKTFEMLTRNQQESAMVLGMNEDVWDCFINHYTSYSRNELENRGLYQHVRTIVNVSKPWERLNDDEIHSATELCYSKETWNKLALGTW